MARGVVVGARKRAILDGVSLSIGPGQFTLIAGESGAGKTTLLNVLSGLRTPDEGEVLYKGTSIDALGTKSYASLRRSSFGFVFQRPNLLPGWTLAENILTAHQAIGAEVCSDDLSDMAGELGLDDVDFRHQFPSELSGGEQQRVALLRAVAHGPSVLFADEPSASLDHENKHALHRSIKALVARGLSAVVVSHDDVAAGYADRRIELKDGRVVGDSGACSDL